MLTTNEEYSVGLVVTARVKSSRIQNKVLQKINGKYAIDLLLDHIVNDQYQIVLAIPESAENDILEEIGRARGIEVYRGHDDSPLHRLAAVADQYNFDYVSRITADDVLIDLFILFRMIKFCIRGGHDYLYMGRCPEGIASEIIRTSVLLDVVRTVGKRPIEFISYYIKNKYKTFEYLPGFEYQFPARLTMDYEEDIMLLRILYASLVNPGTLDIINFLKKNKYLLAINHLPEITVYTCNYNTSKYITDCMDSVLGSSFDDIEYIIIDDGSTDDSLNVITEYYSKLKLHDQRKMKVLRNEKNLGLPSSCNRVLSMARGKYVFRVDSDDCISEGCLDRLYEQVKLNGTHGCISGYNKTNEQLELVDTVNTNDWHPGCALISKWVANEIKYRDGIDFCEGVPFYNEFKKHYKMSFIPDALWSYRQRPGQKTQDINHPNNTEKVAE